VIPMGHPSDIIYTHDDRPPCVVQLQAGDVEWVPGQVDAWYRRQDGWAAHISLAPAASRPARRMLPAAQVRCPEAHDCDWRDRHPSCRPLTAAGGWVT